MESLYRRIFNAWTEYLFIRLAGGGGGVEREE